MRLDDRVVDLPRHAVRPRRDHARRPRSSSRSLVARPALGFAGNIVLLMYLFLLGTFFLALAGLDTGSAFGGMGSSREVAVAALAEPTVILADLRARPARGHDRTSAAIVERLRRASRCSPLNPGHLLAFAAFFIVMLAETGRLPVDNPATHLELTMIHEAMVLEYSGPLPRAGRVGGGHEALPVPDAAREPLLPLGLPASAAPLAALLSAVVRSRSSSPCLAAGAGAPGDGGREAPALPRARAARRLLRARRSSPSPRCSSCAMSERLIEPPRVPRPRDHALLMVWRQSLPGRLRLFAVQSAAPRRCWPSPSPPSPAAPAAPVVARGRRRLKAWCDPARAGPDRRRAPRRGPSRPDARPALRCSCAGALVVVAYVVMLPVSREQPAADARRASRSPSPWRSSASSLCVTGRDALGQILGFLDLRERHLRARPARDLRPAGPRRGRASSSTSWSSSSIAKVVVVQIRREHASIDVDRLRELRG